MLAHTAYGIARALGVPWLFRRLAGGAVILCYHNVVAEPPAEPHDAGLHMAARTFERQMTWLRRAFEPVALGTLLDRLRDGRPTRGLAAVTFDDGYRGFFQTALPILRALAIPVTVFVVADAAEYGAPFWWDHPELAGRADAARREQWLTTGQGLADRIYTMEGVSAVRPSSSERLPASWDTIRHSAGPDLTIGAHTCTHAALPALDAFALRRELEDCAARIAQHLGARPRWLAYPYGAWNAAVRAAAGVAGFEAALTLIPRPVRAARLDLLALPRVNVPGRISPAAFAAWASGLAPRGRLAR